MTNRLFSLLLVSTVAGLMFLGGTSGAGSLQAADISDNFTLQYRTNTAKLFRLYQNPQQIILLEFFIWYCPHCQAATPLVHRDIEEHYAAQNGNPDGLPVTVIYVNLEWRSGTPQTETDNFIRNHDLKLVLNDYPQTAYSYYGGNGTPHFVLLNTVTNSSSHQPWEIVAVESGYSETTTIPALRAAIDSIRAANLPPRLESPRIYADGTFQCLLQGQSGRTNVIEGASGAGSWSVITNLVTSNGTALFRHRNPAGETMRFYRARVQ